MSSNFPNKTCAFHNGRDLLFNRGFFILATAIMMTLLNSCSEPDPSPTIIAHRGASEIAPENTLAAIQAAIEAKTDWIEFDVRAISDGQLYLFHDEDLKRFKIGDTKIETLSAPDAEKIDVGSWFDPKFASERPPTLTTTLEACFAGEVTPLIERKTGSAESYIEVIRELDAVDKVVLQAFDWDFLEAAKKLEPTMKLGALGSKPPTAENWEQLKRLNPDWVGWNQKHLTSKLINEFKAQQFSVAVWTVNDLARIRQFVSFGVDGIISDRPKEAREAVEQMTAGGEN